MIGLDTNVLVRYIVQDDPRQSTAVSNLIEKQCSAESPGWIDAIVLCELVWVLESAYGYTRDIVSGVLRKILETAELLVDDPETTWAALRAYEAGSADFADYLIGVRNRSQGCEVTYTFDKRAATSAWHEAIT